VPLPLSHVRMLGTSLQYIISQLCSRLSK